jgi:hypothetical protein
MIRVQRSPQRKKPGDEPGFLLFDMIARLVPQGTAALLLLMALPVVITVC